MRDLLCPARVAGRRFALLAAVATGGLAASLTAAHAGVGVDTMANWGGTTGYTYGRPYIAANGVVYGTLAVGSTSQSGSVYSLTKSGTAWTQATISSFSGGATGGFPIGGLTPGLTGSTLYGAAYSGGNTSTSVCNVGGYVGCGVIYSLTPPTSGTTWTRNVIYTFQGGTDGSQPAGDLTMDKSGALYGATTFAGCTRTLTYGAGCGIIFKLTPPASGTTWTETVLYRFLGGTDGAYPGGRLVLDAAGNIYGTTLYGGAEKCTLINGTPDSRCGTVFKLTKSGSTYTERVLYAFKNGVNGALPAAGLAMDSAGDLFGAATQGGVITASCIQFGNSGCGLVFELQAPATGSTYKEKALWKFSGSNGAFPTAPIIDANGNLFGVTSLNSDTDAQCSNSFYCGTIYELSPGATKYTPSNLYSFTGRSDNGGPVFGLAADTAGTLYGVSVNNVTSTVFSLTGTNVHSSVSF